MKILIVEDDHVLNNGIALSLANDEVLQAFSVKKAETTKGAKAPFVISIFRFRLIFRIYEYLSLR